MGRALFVKSHAYYYQDFEDEDEDEEETVMASRSTQSSLSATALLKRLRFGGGDERILPGFLVDAVQNARRRRQDWSQQFHS